MNMEEENKEIDKRPIILIDGFNVFLRHFFANPTCTASGDHVGGVVGFIKSIEWIVKNLRPQRIYVVWEKGGPSAKRKSIYPQYKANRAKVDDFAKVNKGKSNQIPLDNESKMKQLLMLTEILKHLPICQVYNQECECDDIIAYIVKHKLPVEIPKIIISSDKDFYQLLTEDVSVYDPGKKNFVTVKDVYERFGIHPRNFVLARTIDGDDSDNIPGINRVGFKTLLKAIPEFGDQEKEFDINLLLETCHKKISENSKYKALQSIIDGEETIRRNWQLMYLGVGILSALQATKINSTLQSFLPKYDHLNFLKTLQKSNIVLPIDFNLLAQELKTCLLTF